MGRTESFMSQQADLIGLAAAAREFGVSRFFLKQHLKIVNLGYRTKLVRRTDLLDLIDRMTVQPEQQQLSAAAEPRQRVPRAGRRRDLLG